jgi:hypothetical protein
VGAGPINIAGFKRIEIGEAGVSGGLLTLRSSGGAQEANISCSATGLAFTTNSYATPFDARASEIIFGTGSSGTERLRITSAGLVGLGTSGVTGTNTRLEVSNDSAEIKVSSTPAYNANFRGIRFGVTGDATPYSGVRFEVNSGELRTEAGFATWGGFQTFYTNGLERVRILSTGAVGIGTTTVSSPLHVKANSTEGIRIESPDFSGIYGLLTSRRSSGSPLDIAAIHSVGALEPVISFSRSTNGSTFTESARIDSSGRLLVGTSTDLGGQKLQIAGTNDQLGISGFISTVPNGPLQFFSRSRGSTVGVNTIVQSGDQLGEIRFRGADGTNYINAALIRAEVDGTPGTDDMPGRLVFSVTRDGSASPTEAVRINNKGFLKASGTGGYYASTGAFHELYSATDNENIAIFYHAGTSGTQYGLAIITANDQNDTTRHLLSCQGGATIRAVIRSNGGLANYSANDVNLSDRNVKKDIAPAANTWDCLKEWEIVNFRYKDQPDNADLNMGVIAQQIAESCPELVTVFQEAKNATNTEPAQEERIGVKEQQMMWMAIKALQEAQLRIETLEAKVAALEGV